MLILLELMLEQQLLKSKHTKDLFHVLVCTLSSSALGNQTELCLHSSKKLKDDVQVIRSPHAININNLITIDRNCCHRICNRCCNAAFSHI
mmetsp:Transcript_23485/g.36249  ORF Transcript_23485/g.36249 Transcript_23485/m.36249 type:complete len:91 (+) Transcript_23485:2440-2712(+)